MIGRVGVLHELARERRHRPVEAGRGIDRVQHRETLGLTDLPVDLTERRRQVHDPRAVLDGHEVGGDHPARVGGEREELERPLVVAPHERFGRHVGEHDGVVAEDGRDPLRRQHQVAAPVAALDPDVADV